MTEPINSQTSIDSPPAGDVDAVELKTIEVRLAGVKEATQRSRYVFIIMTIVTAAILISLWNSMLAWDRGMAFEKRSEDILIAENQKNVTSEWFKNTAISVGLLGIRVGTFDLAAIGSSSLIVIMVWFFFCQRRENRAIVGLLRYCHDGVKENRLCKDVCDLVYEGVVQSIVFIDMGGGDQPIKGLVADNKPSQRNRFIRTIMTGLIFLPPLAILMIVISDMLSLIIPSFLRDSKEALWRVLIDGHHKVAVTKIVLFELYAVLCYTYAFFMCIKCREFSDASSDTIKEFRGKCDARLSADSDVPTTGATSSECKGVG
jgi:hypothetical protein